jgi:hypothetical protein
MNYRIIANVLCLPYMFGFYFLVVVGLWEEWAYGASVDVPSVVEIPAVFIFFFMTSIGGIIYFLGAQLVIIRAWFSDGMRWKTRGLLAIYNIHLLPYLWFVLWWHRTGNHPS